MWQCIKYRCRFQTTDREVAQEHMADHGHIVVAVREELDND